MAETFDFSTIMKEGDGEPKLTSTVLKSIWEGEHGTFPLSRH